MIRIVDRVRTRLSDNNEFDAMHAWSPGGALIAFISNRDGYDAVYVTAADGTPRGG